MERTRFCKQAQSLRTIAFIQLLLKKFGKSQGRLKPGQNLGEFIYYTIPKLAEPSHLQLPQAITPELAM